MTFKWKKDKKSRDKGDNSSVKIISEQGEEIGELKFSLNPKKIEIEDLKS